MELEARTMPEPETQIDLRCPTCGHVWNVAALLTGVWWSRAVTPAAIAALCWCPVCRSAPPMEPAPPPCIFRRPRVQET
jgi:hypothetical protein